MAEGGGERKVSVEAEDKRNLTKASRFSMVKDWSAMQRTDGGGRL